MSKHVNIKLSYSLTWTLESTGYNYNKRIFGIVIREIWHQILRDTEHKLVTDTEDLKSTQNAFLDELITGNPSPEKI